MGESKPELEGIIADETVNFAMRADTAQGQTAASIDLTGVFCSEFLFWPSGSQESTPVLIRCPPSC